MDSVQLSVLKFMALAKQPYLNKPGIPEEKVRLLGLRLAVEEAFLELAYALGFTATVKEWDGDRALCYLENFQLDATHEPDLVEIADAIADGIYVLYWTANACGIDMEEVLAEVCRSNLTKFKDGYSIDEHGKLKKSPLFTPPRIQQLLEIQANPTMILAGERNGRIYHHLAVRPQLPLVVIYANSRGIPLNEFREMFGSWAAQEHLDAVENWSDNNSELFNEEYNSWFGRTHHKPAAKPPF